MGRFLWMDKGHRQLRAGRRSRAGKVYMITTNTVGREPIFENEVYARAAIGAFSSPLLLKDAVLLCWVLMPDHAHWLIRLGQHLPLSTLVANMKSSSARHVRHAGHPNPVWGKGFHDRMLHNESEIPTAIKYILNNPQRAGLVKPEKTYPYQSPP